MATLKTARQMERHLKGMANHYRIEILLLVSGREGITLESFGKPRSKPKTILPH